jgi:regulator of protease activity HflC (stomatin/prohibitin superfamily)
MFWFIAGIVVVLLGVVALAVRKRVAGKPDSRSYDPANTTAMTTVGVVLLLAGIFTVVWDSWTIIPARNVGVVNTFCNANRTLNNGAHLVAPWSSVETIDATVQTFKFDKADNSCVTVRLANQTTACVDTTLQWNIDQQADANSLWQRYRGSNDDVLANVGNNVVKRELQRAMNGVFETYNPLAVLQGGQNLTKTDDLAAQVLTKVRNTVDPGIVIDTVLVSIVHFDDTTQGKLNAFAQALADTQVAMQTEQTNKAIKLANDALASTSSADPGVQYQNCLNLVRYLASVNQLQNLPQTFICSQGAGGTPVIVGAK